MPRNAFFRLFVQDDGLYICIYPPTDGGEELTFIELNIYLSGIKGPRIDKSALKLALAHQTEAVEVKLSDEVIPPVDERFSVKISNDKMKAIVRIYPASDGGGQLNKNDILEKLSAIGVKYGVIETAIDEWMQDRQYCTDIVVAEGMDAEPSSDADIEYFFRIDKEFAPEMDEDGNIDFHQLDLLDLVEAGDVLARLTPACEGKHGTNVMGAKIPSSKPVKKRLTRGTNTVLSEDGCVLSSKVSGHVEMKADKIIVRNVYSVKGDVGTATGDIDYNGTVKVSGDVLSGYAVKATGDIYVEGVVEAANLTAGGKIVLANGVHGDARGRLYAGGNVVAKFIQMCTVVSGDSVSSNSILHSRVVAKNSILAHFGPGLINGGELTAKSLISARFIGSANVGTNTQLEVGYGAEDAEGYSHLEDQLVEKRIEQRRLRSIAGTSPKNSRPSAKRAEVLFQLAALETEIDELLDQYYQLKAGIETYAPGKITVTDAIYEGAKIVVSNASYYVRDVIVACQFVNRAAAVMILSY
ncbi:MAG: FapA family protein [Oscillospiraceae bacterium]|jgi:uncharacterized protein (DUF342 family)|nr:FapA family protein [Oscillospiraceae bacterium]